MLLQSLAVGNGAERLLVAGQGEAQRDGHVMHRRISAQMVGHCRRIGRVSERSQGGGRGRV